MKTEYKLIQNIKKHNIISANLNKMSGSVRPSVSWMAVFHCDQISGHEAPSTG